MSQNDECFGMVFPLYMGTVAEHKSIDD